MRRSGAKGVSQLAPISDVREQDDKSKFLAQAGFTQDNRQLLKAAIRQLADATPAIQDRDRCSIASLVN